MSTVGSIVNLVNLSSFVLALIIMSSDYLVVNAEEWSYENTDTGPKHWKEHYPDCGGLMQSPINIESDKVLYDQNLNYFDLSSYSITRGVNMTLVNKGHTAEVQYTGEDMILKGGNLPDDYKLVQFHFHWGEDDIMGSEHLLNDERFPMEISAENNTQLDSLLQHFSKIEEPDIKAEIEPFPPTRLLSGNKDRLDFYRYFGSLTTPPCYESVIWSLSTEFIPISVPQMTLFRTLHNEKNEHLVNGYRPVQALNHRLVTTTRRPTMRCGVRSYHMETSLSFILLIDLAIELVTSQYM
ncbi:carbonic anhydrase 2-like isoform X2 [Biomphalaria glabrata]|uniref:carbonic anhydrase n=1 Tax=Biomphalaria glabrata TaxID=6526 RepID=A0A9W2YFY0_BIOGL|nr:carbonic anhydrase 2-like isoform X2 [Biomphalaria glabrata]